MKCYFVLYSLIPYSFIYRTCNSACNNYYDIHKTIKFDTKLTCLHGCICDKLENNYYMYQYVCICVKCDKKLIIFQYICIRVKFNKNLIKWQYSLCILHSLFLYVQMSAYYIPSVLKYSIYSIVYCISLYFICIILQLNRYKIVAHKQTLIVCILFCHIPYNSSTQTHKLSSNLWLNIFYTFTKTNIIKYFILLYMSLCRYGKCHTVNNG